MHAEVSRGVIMKHLVLLYLSGTLFFFSVSYFKWQNVSNCWILGWGGSVGIRCNVLFLVLCVWTFLSQTTRRGVSERLQVPITPGRASVGWIWDTQFCAHCPLRAPGVGARVLSLLGCGLTSHRNTAREQGSCRASAALTVRFLGTCWLNTRGGQNPPGFQGSLYYLNSAYITSW